jgi:hypothetical protein
MMVMMMVVVVMVTSGNYNLRRQRCRSGKAKHECERKQTIFHG